MNRRDIFNKYDGHCAYCGKKIEFDDMTIDHIIPLSKNGGNDLANTIPSCQLCNNQKADRSIEEFRAFLEDITETLKAEDQMLWVQRMNSVQETAMEIVNNNLIYS